MKGRNGPRRNLGMRDLGAKVVDVKALRQQCVGVCEE